MNPETHSLCQVLRAAARQEIIPRFQRSDARAKADGSLITQADLGTHAYILDVLKKGFPDVAVLSEEMTAVEQNALMAAGHGRFWCLDPLDGTSNFAAGFPFLAVSLALIQDGQARLGLVLDPIRDECFAAEYQGGAWLNGQPLRLAATPKAIQDCLALVDLKRLPAPLLQRLGAEAPYRSQRSLGAVALEWCWLAAGRTQLYLHGGQRLWDWAAGRLIAQEAGVSSLLIDPATGSPLSSNLSLAPCRALAAADSTLFQHWLSWVGLADDGRGD